MSSEPEVQPKPVLVVDDELSAARALQGLLEDHGYVVCIATSGREALLQMEARSPRLILSDLMMPEMDGLELVSALRSLPQTAGTPVIIMSVAPKPDAFPTDVRFLRKPVALSVLLNTLEHPSG